MSSRNNNPANFANRPKEEVQEIASKGGHASHSGGFASMDPEKQVSTRYKFFMCISDMNIFQREIASKGGKASGGSFTQGSERAKEAGRKGGKASGHNVEQETD